MSKGLFSSLLGVKSVILVKGKSLVPSSWQVAAVDMNKQGIT